MAKPLLSLLIPTIPERSDSCARLLALLHAQSPQGRVEILTNPFAGSTGQKRNVLLGRSSGKYVAFIDDDDLVADDYVERVLAACAKGKDCCSLSGMIHFDNKPSRAFRNSREYTSWTENADGFIRTPNHLNAVRREIAFHVGFPNKTVGEDFDYSNALYPLLNSEADIPGPPLYHYFSQPAVRKRAAGLRFLIKWPTRGRPELFKATLAAHIEALSSRNPVHFLFTVDSDDESWREVADICHTCPALFGYTIEKPGGKIAAINAGKPARLEWDVLVLLADDMVPAEKGWDERIVIDMARNFPHLNGVLDYSDGFRGEPADPEEVSCVTMPVMGRKFYDWVGHIYHPEYQSLWADVELAEVAKARGRAKHIQKVIVRHDWLGQTPDALMTHNESFYQADKAVYDRRKAAGFPRGMSTVYSQNDEENVILREVGGNTGRLLDIGAHDGRTLSNSLKLLELGWSGVLVEPAPGPFQELLKRHSGNPRVTLVNAAVAAKSGLVVFQESTGDLVSTLSDAHAAVWSGAGIKWRPYMLQAINPEALFRHVGWEFDFINLDVEGVNMQVFKAIDWAMLVRHGLRLVCIEHEGHAAEIEAELAPLGFEACSENAENVILRRKPV